MRAFITIPLAAAAILIAGCSRQSQPRASGLPPEIQPILPLVQGKSGGEIRKIIVDHFGPAHRTTGSGIISERWDIANGVLTFNPAVGPSFTPKGQSKIHLLATHNPIKTNLLGGYEMVSPASHNPNGVKCWLGNLQIQPDLSYTYKDSGQFPDKSSRQAATNFFYLHPLGAVEIEYASGVTDEVLLETLPTNSVVASLHFRAADGRVQQTFTITSDEPGRRLTFGGPATASFEMDKGWESFWK